MKAGAEPGLLALRGAGPDEREAEEDRPRECHGAGGVRRLGRLRGRSR